MNDNNSKLKICFFINGFGGGGAEKQCAYLINELQKDENLSISLVYFFEGINFHMVNQEKIQIFKVPSSSLYSFENIPLTKNIIAKIEPDIVFTWMQAPDVLAFFLKIKFKKIKWILAERSSKYSFFDYRYVLRAIVGRFSDLIICNSEEGKSYWRKRFIPGKKIVIAPNILYKPDVKKLNHNVINGSPKILFAGRLEEQKNVLTLARAFCLLADKYPDGRFYIIGKGSLKDKIVSIIKEKQKDHQVIVMPFQKNILDYFASTDIFVSVSNYEGLPNTVIENVSLNNKIVVSKITEHTNILGNQFKYYVNNLNNEQEISEVIESSLFDQDYAPQLDYAREKIKKMSPENVVAVYKQYFTAIK